MIATIKHGEVIAVLLQDLLSNPADLSPLYELVDLSRMMQDQIEAAVVQIPAVITLLEPLQTSSDESIRDFAIWLISAKICHDISALNTQASEELFKPDPSPALLSAYLTTILLMLKDHKGIQACIDEDTGALIQDISALALSNRAQYQTCLLLSDAILSKLEPQTATSPILSKLEPPTATSPIF